MDIAKPSRYPRFVDVRLAAAMQDTRVVFVAGARQVGKSTLATEIFERIGGSSHVTFDDALTRDAARFDPVAFIDGLRRPALIDEVQRVPDVLLEIKRVVDRDATPGQFLLTGSANIATIKSVADALTGRVEHVPLRPLSLAERVSVDGLRAENFVDRLFSGSPEWDADAESGLRSYAELIAAGGYPEAHGRPSDRRTRWFQSYLENTITRDLSEVSAAHKLDLLPRLTRLLAAQTAQVFSNNEIAKKLDINLHTVASYISLLEAGYIVERIPAWRPSLGAREVKRPKLAFVDTGLLSYCLRADAERIAGDQRISGMAFENFVVAEVMKHIDSASMIADAFHYRDQRHEVDLVLESVEGRVACLEVKARSTYKASDSAGMRKLRDLLGERFAGGVVVNTGTTALKVSDRIWSVPAKQLWTDRNASLRNRGSRAAP